MYKFNVISTKAELLTSGFRNSLIPDHNGADFVDANRQEATPRGVDIISIADGTVAEYIVGNLVGVTVAISHEGKILSRYQHMRLGSVPVKVGEKVKKGQVIGVMGNTGECYSSNTSIPPEYRGTHLHLGIKENSTAYDNGTWVDPVLYLKGEKIISGAGELTTEQYEELKELIAGLKKDNDNLRNIISDMAEKNAALRQDLTNWTKNSRVLYQWVDSNMPDWARPAVHKLTQKKYLLGDENGRLQLSSDMLRMFVTLDRAGAYDK